MSRSYYHTPCKGVASCASEKEDKKMYNRKLRRKVNQCSLDACYIEEFDSTNLPLLKEVSNLWEMGKYGKCFFTKKDFHSMYTYFTKGKGANTQDFYTYCRRIFKK